MLSYTSRAGRTPVDRSVYAGRMSGTTSAAVDRLHAAFAARVQQREFPGAVVMVARGEDIHCHAIGTTSFDSAEPMRRDTPFRIASLTKPIVAAATMMLVEDGQLRLDDPVDRWLPELAKRPVRDR